MADIKSNSGSLLKNGNFQELVAEISSVQWFDNVGSEVADGTKCLIQGYLAGLGYVADSIQLVSDASHLQDCIKNRFDPNWMTAESNAFKNLLEEFDHSDNDSSFNDALHRTISELSTRILTLADHRLLCPDRYLARVAAGSAAETCFRYVLESTLSCGQSKLFTSKFKIFQLGRWPLCFSEGSYIIY